MSRQTRFINIIAIVLVALVGIALWHHQATAPTNTNLTTVVIKDHTIEVETATTPAEQEQGLSDRTSLAPDHGMLFIFDQPGIYPFWMKEMNFPLDIIWLDANKKIVQINANLSPATYPTNFGTTVPIKYVLEVNAGVAQKYNIAVGDQASF